MGLCELIAAKDIVNNIILLDINKEKAVGKALLKLKKEFNSKII
ncbi:hypothetical protein ACWNY2_00175 [Candidatus Karelsulcia muelleri]